MAVIVLSTAMTTADSNFKRHTTRSCKTFLKEVSFSTEETMHASRGSTVKKSCDPSAKDTNQESPDAEKQANTSNNVQAPKHRSLPSRLKAAQIYRMAGLITTVRQQEQVNARSLRHGPGFVVDDGGDARAVGRPEGVGVGAAALGALPRLDVCQHAAADERARSLGNERD
eukprot:5098968-Pleurochrysis_carterae.AAC.5